MGQMEQPWQDGDWACLVMYVQVFAAQRASKRAYGGQVLCLAICGWIYARFHNRRPMLCRHMRLATAEDKHGHGIQLNTTENGEAVRPGGRKPRVFSVAFLEVLQFITPSFSFAGFRGPASGNVDRDQGQNLKWRRREGPPRWV